MDSLPINSKICSKIVPKPVDQPIVSCQIGIRIIGVLLPAFTKVSEPCIAE